VLDCCAQLQCWIAASKSTYTPVESVCIPYTPVESACSRYCACVFREQCDNGQGCTCDVIASQGQAYSELHPSLAQAQHLSIIVTCLGSYARLQIRLSTADTPIVTSLQPQLALTSPYTPTNSLPTTPLPAAQDARARHLKDNGRIAPRAPQR
jgi:hypothetical protein